MRLKYLFSSLKFYMSREERRRCINLKFGWQICLTILIAMYCMACIL